MWPWISAADPGRVHTEGRMARVALEDARERVAALLGTRPRQVIFTSGGTESINAAVYGALHSGRGVALAAIEHSAVREASARYAGHEVTLLVDGAGRILTESVRVALEDADLGLVHCQWANHEVGTLQPVHEIVGLCRAAGVPVHVDAAAACGHVPLDLADLGADLVSLSAHKIGGLPGAGALVIRRGSRFEPLIVGGEQERARRAAAAALGADDSRLLRAEADSAREAIAALAASATAVEGVDVVGPTRPEQRLPSLLCLGVHGVEAEPVLIGLDRAGVAVHSGSACSSESIEPSPVLEAMGVDASHSLRVSVGWSTTEEDVAAFGTAFAEVVAGLRALRG